MNELFADTGQMVLIIVMVCIIVLAAMIIDLIAGIIKARQRGELRSSWGLKRSLSKFITYEGGILIAAGVDLLIHFCHLMELFHLDIISGVPVVSCLLGIFLLVVELISVRETADAKTRTEIARVADMAQRMVSKEELVDVLTQAIKAANKHDHESQ